MADANSNAALPAYPVPEPLERPGDGTLPDGAPRSGVIHVRHRHTSGFTVIGNHLAQHAGLSAVAIGLAVHILSLPDGSPVTVKALAAHFSEGEITIRRGLNELVASGYVERRRVRLDGGRFATRTFAYDWPRVEVVDPSPRPRGSRRGGRPVPRPRGFGAGEGPSPGRGDPGAAGEAGVASGREGSARPGGGSGVAPTDPGVARDTGTRPGRGPFPRPRTGAGAAPTDLGVARDVRPGASGAPAGAVALERGPVPTQARVPEDAPAAVRAPESVTSPGPAAGPAADLLARLRLADPRLLLSVRDIAGLAPAVETWRDRGVDAQQIARALTAGLPQGPIHHPGRLLAHRLVALMPPPLPPSPSPSLSSGPPGRPAPLHTCDGCERAFRTHDPTARCASCRVHVRSAPSAA